MLSKARKSRGIKLRRSVLSPKPMKNLDLPDFLRENRILLGKYAEKHGYTIADEIPKFSQANLLAVQKSPERFAEQGV